MCRSTEGVKQWILNQNFDKPFEYLKIELETKLFFVSMWNFSLVSGTELKFSLSAVVVKIWHVEVDIVKSQDICSV